MPKLRTLFIHAALAPYRIDLLNYLHQHVDLKAVFLRRNMPGQEYDQAALRRELQCDCSYLLRGFEINGRVFRTGLRRTIAEFDPDVIVTHEYSPTTLALALVGKRLLRQPWGLTILTTDNERIAGDAGWVRTMARRVALGAADSVIAYTEKAKAWLAGRGVPEHRIFVCANRQSEIRFADALDDALPRAARAIRDNDLAGKRIVLFVGRLVEIKGIDRIIRAFARVSRTVPDSVLVVVGEGPERTRLQQLAAREGVATRVRFEGQRFGQDVMAWYLLGHILVLASHWECYGAVVNEALLAGMPVLCSSWAGAVELIRDAYNGHAFHPYDIDGLAQHMTDWLHAATPLGGRPLVRRPSLMLDTFEEAAHPFVRGIEYAALSSRRRVEATC